MILTSMVWPSAVLGTTMKRRERGGTLSGSGATWISPEALGGTARLQSSKCKAHVKRCGCAVMDHQSCTGMSLPQIASRWQDHWQLPVPSGFSSGASTLALAMITGMSVDPGPYWH